MKLIHLITDEKFIDGAFFTFEKAFPNENTYLILKSPSNPPIRYLKSTRIDIVLFRSNKVMKQLESITDDFDWIIVHGLNELWTQFIINNPHKKTLYIVWGAEIYGNPLLYNKTLFGDKTALLAKKLNKNILFQQFKMFVRKQLYGFNIATQIDRWKQTVKALKTIDKISILYEEEISFYRELKIISAKTEYLKFGYYPIEYIKSGLDINNQLGNNIMVGNSSSLSNNHLEIFDKLLNLNSKNKIIVPLSYGDKKLARLIVQKGKCLFGNQFIPITEFMPLAEYTKIMQTCNVVIMNHYRQQAVGNILSSVYLGAKVFLNPKNSIYDYLKRLGCYIFDVNIDLNSISDLEPLSQYQIKINREKLQADISQEVFIKNLKTGLSKSKTRNEV